MHRTAIHTSCEHRVHTIFFMPRSPILFTELFGSCKRLAHAGVDLGADVALGKIHFAHVAPGLAMLCAECSSDFIVRNAWSAVCSCIWIEEARGHLFDALLRIDTKSIASIYWATRLVHRGRTVCSLLDAPARFTAKMLLICDHDYSAPGGGQVPQKSLKVPLFV
jgi:hypothetical protein